MKHLKLMVLFALVALVGCEDHVLIGEGEGLPDAAASVCISGAQISCGCLGGDKGVQVCKSDGSGYNPCQCPDEPDAGSDAIAEAAAPDAELEADAQAETSTTLMKCAVKTTVDFGATDPTFIPAVGAKGFGLALCVAGSTCALRTLDFEGNSAGDVTVADTTDMFGIVAYGSPQGYLLGYAAMTTQGERFRTARVIGNALTVDYEDPTYPAANLAGLENGGYWMSQTVFDLTINTSSAVIRYVAPNGVIGNQLVLASGKDLNVQNTVTGLAVSGDVVGAAVNTVDDKGMRTASVFLRQADSTMIRIDLMEFPVGSADDAYTGEIFTRTDGRFALRWYENKGGDFFAHVSLISQSGGSLTTLDVPTDQIVTPIGDNLAAVEYDQVMLKVKLRVFDDAMKPITEPLVVVQDVKGYYMNYPRAVGNSIDSMMVAYTEQQKDASFVAKAAFIDCK